METGVEFSLVVATYNESANLPALLAQASECLKGFSYEIVVVDDDSPDLTWKVAEDHGRAHPEVRVIRRQGRRGLSSAICEGFEAGRGRFLAVIDADLSHDPALLPLFIEQLRAGKDIVVGSRRVAGGAIIGWPASRWLYSYGATFVARLLLIGSRVKDPLSGYFALTRETFETLRATMKPKGYKILLDILARSPDARVAEVPYVFKNRTEGKSKLSPLVAFQFFEMLWDLRAHARPRR